MIQKMKLKEAILQYQLHMLSVGFDRGIEIEVCLYILRRFGLGQEA